MHLVKADQPPCSSMPPPPSVRPSEASGSGKRKASDRDKSLSTAKKVREGHLTAHRFLNHWEEWWLLTASLHHASSLQRMLKCSICKCVSVDITIHLAYSLLCKWYKIWTGHTHTHTQFSGGYRRCNRFHLINRLSLTHWSSPMQSLIHIERSLIGRSIAVSNEIRLPDNMSLYLYKHQY